MASDKIKHPKEKDGKLKRNYCFAYGKKSDLRPAQAHLEPHTGGYPLVGVPILMSKQLWVFLFTGLAFQVKYKLRLWDVSGKEYPDHENNIEFDPTADAGLQETSADYSTGAEQKRPYGTVIDYPTAGAVVGGDFCAYGTTGATEGPGVAELDPDSGNKNYLYGPPDCATYWCFEFSLVDPGTTRLRVTIGGQASSWRTFTVTV